MNQAIAAAKAARTSEDQEGSCPPQSSEKGSSHQFRPLGAMYRLCARPMVRLLNEACLIQHGVSSDHAQG